MTQREFADAVGSSLRTVARWEDGKSSAFGTQYHRLAALLYPLDPAMARDAARAGGTTLEQLGIVAPAPPIESVVAIPVAPPAPTVAPPAPTTPPAPPLPVRLLVDAVVCSVAAALETAAGAPVTLAHARAATAAALTSARDLRLDLDAAIDVIAPRPAASAPAGAAAGEKPAGAKSSRRGTATRT
jgi:hypothetical protein